MANEELIGEFEKRFEEMKAKLGFKSSLEQLDRIFYLRDFIAKEGYVGSRLSRMVCSRIISTFSVWENYFHAIIVPNPNNMPNVEESKMASEEDKKEMLRIMTQIRELNTRNTVVSLEEDERAEGKLIDDALLLWETNKPFFLKMMKKVNAGWAKSTSDAGQGKASHLKKENGGQESFFG